MMLLVVYVKQDDIVEFYKNFFDNGYNGMMIFLSRNTLPLNWIKMLTMNVFDVEDNNDDNRQCNHVIVVIIMILMVVFITILILCIHFLEEVVS